MSASVQPAPAQRSNAEPSMEEILASIRRIIAEDQKALDAKAETPAGAALAETAPAVSDDVDEDEAFDLASIAPPRVAVPTPEPVSAPLFPELRPIVSQSVTPLHEAPAAAPTATVAPITEVETPLISAATQSAASAAFQSLTHTVFTQQSKTMDELVSEMLRPMLTSWLDEHLPALVERLVKAEIERVARGGR